MTITVWCHKSPYNSFETRYHPETKHLALGVAHKISGVEIDELLVLLRRPDFARQGPQNIQIRKVFDPMFNYTYVALTLHYNTYYLEPAVAVLLADEIAALIN